MNWKKIIFIFILLVALFVIHTPYVLAQCNEENEINTAIGCINVKSPEGFVTSILNLAIGIGGGIAMLLIIFGGIQILTSGGNPDSVKAGKEMITSAIAGLILIIFAVFILRLIGVEILGIFE